MLQVDEAQVCLAQAQTHWQAQRWQEAIQACAKALAFDQKLVLAHKLMGNALQKTGKANEALGYYREALNLNPNYAEVYANLGTIYAQQQEWQQAIAHYQKALAINPEFTLVKSYLKSCLDAQKSTQPDNPVYAYHLTQAQALQQQGNQPGAVSEYLKAAQIEPQRLEPYQEIVRLYEAQEQWTEAAIYCRKILQLTKNHQEQSALREAAPARNPVQSTAASGAAYLAKGEHWLQQGKQQEAFNCFRQALKLEPGLVQGYIALGELLSKSGQLDQAISCYGQGLQQQSHPELYWRLGNLYQAQKHWSQAAQCYRQVNQYHGGHSGAYHKLGEVLSEQLQWPEASAAYRQAIKLNPDFAWSFNNLGYALIQQERWSEAIPVYLKAIELNPQFPWSHYNLGEAHNHLQHWSSAIKYYRQAAAIQPDLPQVQQKLGTVLFNRSQEEQQEALKHFRLAIEQEPENSDLYHLALGIDKHNLPLYVQLGKLFENKQDFAQALVTYQLALQIQPHNREVLERLENLKSCGGLQGDLIHNDFVANAAPVKVSLEVPQAENLASSPEIQQVVSELASRLPHSEHPQVSIIIPVYNQLAYTVQCLQAIAFNLSSATAVEIILVDDCSTDGTAQVLALLPSLKTFEQSTNQGFIQACNRGAAEAQGQYLYFLNNDTEIQPQAVESLVKTLEQDPEVGAVGSKLVYPQGSLQEAGGIIWQDGSGWNYGRQENPYAPEYNYLRPVDYCSGASLMVRRQIFTDLGGFNRDFLPAYYEDTDLCLAIRHQLGLKVMYQPQSVVVHHEGISCGTEVTGGTKRFQVVNAAKFERKWQTNLHHGYLPNRGISQVPTAARRHLGEQTVLVIDSYMPCFDRESGSRRLFELLKIFKSLNFHVIFAADNGVKEEPYVALLQELQIETIYTQSGYGTLIEQQIQERLPIIDFAWICRPELNEKYAPIIRQRSEIKLIYDTIDLHYIRLKRAWELSPERDSSMAKEWIEMQSRELKTAHEADLTITVTSTEKEILHQQAVEQVAVIPNIHHPYQGSIPGFQERSGILFIGSYNHPPNIDAVLWLCQEIMPLVWQKKPQLKVTLLGNNPNAEVLALQSDRISVTGYIDDVTPYFLSHKLSVSPLRYGAGMKGKIGHSLEYGLPIVATSIGTEGMNLVPNQHILEANDTEEFASQILLLSQNETLWQQLSTNASSVIEPYYPGNIKEELSKILGNMNQ